MVKRTIRKTEKGKDALVRGAEVKVYQSTKDKITKIFCPLQLIIALELSEFNSNELDSEQEGNASRP